MVKWKGWLSSRILIITGLKYWTVTIWLNHFKAILKWYIQHWTDTIKLNLANWHFEASDNYLPECWVDFRSNFKIRKYLPLQGRMYPRGNFLWDLCDGRPVRWWAESAPSHWLNRVKVSENLGATVVVPVAPVDTSPSLSSWNESQLSTWADWIIARLLAAIKQNGFDFNSWNSFWKSQNLALSIWKWQKVDMLHLKARAIRELKVCFTT